LTKREKEVLTLLYRGMSYSHIASALYITVNTVKYHTKNIYSKTGARNRVELMAKQMKAEKLP